PANGVLIGAAPNLTYVPNPNFFGADMFSYQASDGSLKSAPTTVTITVSPVNDAPVATSKSTQTLQNSALAILLSGEDADGDSLSFTVVSGPRHGELSGTPPNLTYTPAFNYLGPDSLTFVVSDGIATSASATISISVFSANSRIKIRRTSVTNL